MRRPLADTLIELADAVVPTDRGGDRLLRITRLFVNVPIEIRLEKSGEDWELHADLPQWRWQTGLEELRGRLQLSWEEGGAA